MKRSLDAVRFSGAGLFFAAAGLLTLLAGFTVYSYMHAAVQTETVLVVNHDLPPGATITDNDVDAKALPVGGVPAQAIRERNKAVGQRVRFGIVAGDVLQTGQLVRKGGDIANQVAGMGEEYRAVMIPGDLVPAIDRLVPGDRLELTGVLPYQEQKANTTITVPLGIATVLDVPRMGSQNDRSVVLVAVKGHEASALGLAMKSGTLMVAVLGNDKESPAAPPLRLDIMTSTAGQAKPAGTPTQSTPPAAPPAGQAAAQPQKNP
ncbi:MAG TPA: SAF domain-containing protein [Symbiobacteriaceae bacterium]|jgi:Flp pilus assembly protein CpaB